TLGYTGGSDAKSGSGSLGAAASVNGITNTVNASINGSTVTSAGPVALTATTQKGLVFDPSTISNNTITVNTDPHLKTGDPVQYAITNGSGISQLTAGST